MPKIFKCTPNIELILYLSCHEKENGKPNFVSSNLSGPNIEWKIPPNSKIPELIIWNAFITNIGYVLIISPPGPDLYAKIIKCDMRIKPCSYIGFSFI